MGVVSFLCFAFFLLFRSLRHFGFILVSWFRLYVSFVVSCFSPWVLYFSLVRGSLSFKSFFESLGFMVSQF